MKTITVPLELPVRRVADLLCCAFEGGIGYWCRIMEERKPRRLSPPLLDAKHRWPYIDFPLTGGAVVCRVTDEGSDEEYAPLVLDGEAIARGLALLPTKAPKHFGRFLAEDEDADTGDVFVQLCLFGEVRYG